MPGAILHGLCLLLLAMSSTWAGERLSLKGEWRFALDRENKGTSEEWFQRNLPGRIHLPGSLQEQGFGDEISTNTVWTGTLNDRSWFTAEKYAPYRQPGNIKVPFWLQPDKYYVGTAWYQRDVTIPRNWAGKHVVLHLERAHWGTTVWVDDRSVGQCDALCVPHNYNLGNALTPGTHRLTIRVDNRVLVPVGDNAHSVSDHTQGNWNGLAGELCLRATEPVWIKDLEVFPEVASRSAHLRVVIGNETGGEGSGTLEVHAESYNSPRHSARPSKSVSVHWDAAGGQLELDYDLGTNALLWDEFNPALYRLTAQIQGITDPRTVTFGLREIKAEGKQLAVNGRKIFLRGTLECCIFPLHGYPPTDVASWKHVLTVARAHGLNHLRFHSYCPPEAAFIAADEMGFYYQVECSAWSHSFNRGTALDTWIYAESERIVKEHGNHPSFVLMVPSNEPGGPHYEEFLGKFVAYWKARDARRLYACGSGWPISEEDQFHVTAKSRAFPVHARLGETSNDYSAFLALQDRPIVSHEIGQYCVFPNLDEIPKYKGLLKAKNFEIVRDFLGHGGMGNQGRDFLRASGKLQALFYKDEIEACLRTAGWAGFALLDLHDFPGQGTALVGVLDPFWDEKGYITAAEYRRFCDETVPLARLPKRIWTSAENFGAQIDVAHYGEHDLLGQPARWQIRTSGGQPIAQGQLEPATLRTGALTTLGQVELGLGRFNEPAALNLEVRLPGTRFANDWNFWVYPEQVPTNAPGPVVVSTEFDAATARALENGRSVVLLPDPRRFQCRTVGRFDPIFWNKLWFPTQPQHTLGLLLDPHHPALRQFPTSFHSDWQWQDLQNESHPVVLDSFPKEYRPIVQVIDDWNSCRKLGLVFEAKVGPGRLLVCAIDLNRDLQNRPAARQLRASLLAYAAGKSFHPRTRVEPAQVHNLFRDLTQMEKAGAKVIHADSAQRGYEADLVLDGDPTTLWHTPWGQNAKGFPHELVIRFDHALKLAGLRLLPRQDNIRNGWIKGYAVYVSEDGKQWGDPVAQGELAADKSEKEVRFTTPLKARFIKFVAQSSYEEGEPYASLAELGLIAAPR